MSADKYPGIFSRQMEAIVYLYHDPLMEGDLLRRRVHEGKSRNQENLAHSGHVCNNYYTFTYIIVTAPPESEGCVT